jgi:hypothetical protein
MNIYMYVTYLIMFEYIYNLHEHTFVFSQVKQEGLASMLQSTLLINSFDSKAWHKDNVQNGTKVVTYIYVFM